MHPQQSSERPAGQSQQAPQEAITGDHEEINLLLQERRQPSSKESHNGNHISNYGDTEKAGNSPTITLHRSSYIFLMVFIYSALALTAWSLICVLKFRPLTTDQYGFDTRKRSYTYGSIETKYVRSEEVYRAARILQAVVGVLTIPLTSAVCSAAAVIFAQSKGKERHLTMRQMMTLADRGWTYPKTLTKLISGQGRRISSSLLICAVLLNVFGASITPLQTVFVSQKTIKTPTQSSFVYNIARSGIVDIPDKFDTTDEANSASLVTIMTRNALKSTSNITPQPRLWQESIGCSSSNKSDTEQCIIGATTLGNFSALSRPYLAQLPVGYHTGLIKQYIPRINSTVSSESIPPEEMPTNCGEMPDSFYAMYANATSEQDSQYRVASNWSIEACMPGNQSASPWTNTYSRQDFTEVLYLNISVMGYSDPYYSGPAEGPDSPLSGGIFKITSNTTAGYFELPSYMNGGQPGPIINGDPDDDEHCGNDCDTQNYRRISNSPRAAPSVSNVQGNGSLSLAVVANRGPLLTVAIALFGYDSFISARLQRPESFIRDVDSLPYQRDGSIAEYSSACVDQKPLSSLLHGPDESTSVDCISDTIYTLEDLDVELAQYVKSLYLTYESGWGITSGGGGQDPERSTNAFTSAVFLASEAWLTSDLLNANRQVNSDPGADTVIPEISRTAMILVSLLWMVYIVSLFSLAVYSARTPRWTSQLDAFAMVRVGATTRDRIGLDVAFQTWDIEALDEMPGAIGDATGGEGDVGVLGLGATMPLNGARRYKSYRGQEKKKSWRAYRRVLYDEREQIRTMRGPHGQLYRVGDNKES